MNPVLILQNLTGDGPAYLRTWLEREGVPFEVSNAEAGDARPATMDGWSGLAVLGGEMGANDDLPFLRETERLILDAVARDVPTIGHCLGGQLIAKALGARVHASPRPEIGWQPIDVLPHRDAAAWFGPDARPTVFQWHHDAFDLPAGAVRLAGNAACPNQAFAIGPHLALQFHLEIDEEKLLRWSRDASPRDRADRLAHPDTVHDGDTMRAGRADFLPAQHALADRIYRRWLRRG